MSRHPAATGTILLAVVASSAGCDAVERARSRLGRTTTDTIVTATGSGLALGLQLPPTLRLGEEGVLRLSLTNHADTAVSNVRLELVVPGWAEPLPPRVGDRPVTMSALGDGSTLFVYRLDESDARLAPKQAQTVEQRIRVPASGPMKGGTGAWTRIVRARLLTGDGRPLAQVESAIAVDSAAIAAARPASAPNPTDWRDRLGEVHLGMTAVAVKQAVPAAKDTTWMDAGVRHRGLVFSVANGAAVAALSQDTVARIEVAHPAVRTAEGLGVGSRVEQLRAAYGSPCADATRGRVIVWFAAAPGISFALNSPVPSNAAQLRENPDRIPSMAQVARWWLSRDVESCVR